MRHIAEAADLIGACVCTPGDGSLFLGPRGFLGVHPSNRRILRLGIPEHDGRGKH
jgi:hypothetical protein